MAVAVCGFHKSMKTLTPFDSKDSYGFQQSFINYQEINTTLLQTEHGMEDIMHLAKNFGLRIRNGKT